jgi:nucleotide-binding universal stress UspA family protein
LASLFHILIFQNYASYIKKKVTLVHVQDKSRIDRHLSHRLEEFNEIDTNRLQEIKKVLLDEGAVDVEIQLLYGSPSAEIIRLVHEQKIPLVVMGSQGRGFVKELYLGSVSHNMSRHSSASVLLVPAKREKTSN